MEFVFRRSYRGPLKAVLLDWAGTTMDYGCMAPAVVFMDVFKRKGVEITIDEAREPMGAHKKVHIRQITKNESVAKRWEQKHRRRPNEDDVMAMFEDFVPLQLRCLARYADLIPGTLEAVAEFRRRGLKIGDTLPDISEGLNAGMWMIGLAKTGNEMGLTEEEIAALDPEVRSARMARAYKRMAQAGAHYVVDGIADVAPLLDDIEARLARGDRP